MMHLPSPFKGGNILAFCQKLRDQVLRQRIIPGPGLSASEGRNGTVISVLKKGRGGNSVAGCNGFQIIKRTVDGEAKLIVKGGTVGTEAVEEEDLGLLTANASKSILIKITLDGTAGTYTAEIEAISPVPDDTEELTYVSLGTTDAEGKITQLRCGNIPVQVCRNWYAAVAPFYGLTVL